MIPKSTNHAVVVNGIITEKLGKAAAFKAAAKAKKEGNRAYVALTMKPVGHEFKRET